MTTDPNFKWLISERCYEPLPESINDHEGRALVWRLLIGFAGLVVLLAIVGAVMA